MITLSWPRTRVTRLRAQRQPAFTAGGRREAEMATPTIDPLFPPKVLKSHSTVKQLNQAFYKSGLEFKSWYHNAIGVKMGAFCYAV